MAQLGMGLAGGLIGSQFGIPGIGFTIGSMVGSWLFPASGTTTEGAKLSDLKVTNSAYGAMINIVYGTIRIAGGMIWATDLVEHAQTQETGGGGSGGLFGGDGGSQTTYTYSCSWATVLCEGVVNDILRVWFDEKLIYDKTGGSEAVTTDWASNGDTNLGTQSINFTFYKGDESQLPDTFMESHIGAGIVPANRGLAYLVFKDIPLANFGNRIPNVTAEVCKTTTEIISEVTTVTVSIP